MVNIYSTYLVKTAFCILQARSSLLDIINQSSSLGRGECTLRLVSVLRANKVLLQASLRGMCKVPSSASIGLFGSCLILLIFSV
jgi:hypothetical protein